VPHPDVCGTLFVGIGRLYDPSEQFTSTSLNITSRTWYSLGVKDEIAQRSRPNVKPEKGSTVKRVKVLGPITVIAIFAMALLGPSLAMGESTLLCEADEESECASPVSHLHTEADDLEVLTSSMDYKCDGLFLGTVGELGEPQLVEGNFTYSSCNNSCIRTEENGPAVIEFLKTGHESAKGTGESLVHVVCGSFINCRYTLQGLVGNVLGPLLSSEENGEISFVEATLSKESGALCPTIGKLDAKFVPLSPIYISS
jgi:hypothetical protein